MNVSRKELESYAMAYPDLVGFVCSHLGANEYSFQIIREMNSCDKAAIGRYVKYHHDSSFLITEEEKEEADIVGKRYFELMEWVNEQNYLVRPVSKMQ